MCLGLVQDFITLKSDSGAELSFLQLSFYANNLPPTPHPLTLRLGFYWWQHKHQADQSTLLDELVGVKHVVHLLLQERIRQRVQRIMLAALPLTEDVYTDEINTPPRSS